MARWHADIVGSPTVFLGSGDGSPTPAAPSLAGQISHESLDSPKNASKTSVLLLERVLWRISVSFRQSGQLEEFRGFASPGRPGFAVSRKGIVGKSKLWPRTRARSGPSSNHRGLLAQAQGKTTVVGRRRSVCDLTGQFLAIRVPSRPIHGAEDWPALLSPQQATVPLVRRPQV